MQKFISKKFSHRNYLFKIIVFVSLTSQLFSQNNSTKRENHPVHKSFLSFKHNFGEGIGYDQGFTAGNLMLFYNGKTETDFLPFLDFRALVFNDGRAGGSIGIGRRFQSPTSSFIGGINLFYDIRSTPKHFYNQVGAGVEILQQTYLKIDVRANVYFPVENATRLKKCKFDDYLDNYYIHQKILEVPQRGITLEVGKAFSFAKHYKTYHTIEGYYYTADRCCKHPIGGKFSSSINVKLLKIEGSISHDPVFGTRVQGVVSIRIPLMSPTQEKDVPLYQSVRRNDTIVIRKCCRWDWNY